MKRGTYQPHKPLWPLLQCRNPKLLQHLYHQRHDQVTKHSKDGSLKTWCYCAGILQEEGFFLDEALYKDSP